MPHRLKAFTLLELTIAMLLVAVLAIAVYQAFGIFVRISRDQQQQKIENYSVDLLRHRLRLDTYQSDSIRYDAPILTYYDSLGTVQYQFLDDMVVRDQNGMRRDSFATAYSDLQVQYETDSLQSTDLVNKIDLIFHHKGKALPLHLEKTYTAMQLMQTQP